MRLPAFIDTRGRPAPALNAALSLLVAIAGAVYHPLLLPWKMLWCQNQAMCHHPVNMCGASVRAPAEDAPWPSNAPAP